MHTTRSPLACIDHRSGRLAGTTAFLLLALGLFINPSGPRLASAQNPSADRAQNASPPVVKGTLVGHDGAALDISHVHLRPYGGERVRSISVGPDRSFRAPLDTSGVVELRFTGKNHQMQNTTVFAQPGDTIGVDVRLGTFPVRDTMDLKIIGSFNDFSRENGTIPMDRRADGTYAASVPSPGDSLTYGVLGARPDGTQMDTLVYAGDGNYRPRIAAPGDTTRVVYDPEGVPRGDTGPLVRFRDTTSTAARYAAFVDRLESRRETFSDALQSAENREEQKTVLDTFDWSPNRKRLAQAIEKEPPAGIANAYRTAYLASTFDPDSTVAKKALATIPASSPLWGGIGSGNALTDAIRAAGGFGEREDFAYKVLRETPVDRVEAQVLMALLQRAANSGNTEKQKLLYSWMEAEHSGTRMIQFARSRYAPGRAIQAGKPVPSFEATALRDTAKTFTPASFDGQYVLLDFWATWCGPCVEELPTLRKADSTYGGEDFAILSLSFDRSRSTVTGFLKNHEMPWKHAFAEGGFRSTLADQFEVTGLPKPILVGPDGRIVTADSHKLRGERLLNTLAKHLGPKDEKPKGKTSGSE
ncbi:MAG: TlpA family protein disulfide reductase [Salinibacter sp.]|uniref:TlpA family protein disulfide reductase n=1 Tax=Salinibacter sp. TaxID=2065818 RepID=UPI0035D48E35